MNQGPSLSSGTSPFLTEAVCASLIEQGIKLEDIDLTLRGGFKKAYHTDIEKIEIEELKGIPVASVWVNRNSLYDILPEGLFHQTKGMQAVHNVRLAVEEYKKFNEEEMYARKFFSPLEAMILRYRVLAEIYERKVLYNEEEEKLSGYLFDFWKIEKSLPKEEAIRLIHLMPYLNEIKGNIKATEVALSYILNQIVEIVEIEKHSTSKSENMVPLKEMRLGMNSVTGNNSNEIFTGWLIQLMDIKEESLEQYVDNAPFGKLLMRFSEIFIPVDRDIYFDFKVGASDVGKECSYILGYGCTI